MKRLNLFILFMLVASVIITACGPAASVEPTPTPVIDTCPMRVELNVWLYESLSSQGAEHLLLNADTLKLTATGGYSEEVRDTYWHLDEGEYAKLEAYLVETAETLKRGFVDSLVGAFGGPDFRMVMSEDITLYGWAGNLVGFGECSATGEFRKEIVLYPSSRGAFRQTSTSDNKVYFHFTTEAGSTFNFWVSEEQFIAILMDGDTGHSPVGMTIQGVEPFRYSGEITRLLMDDAIELGSYAIVPEDVQGRAEIYVLVKLLLRYASGDIVILNTFDTEGEQNSKLLGTIIVSEQ